MSRLARYIILGYMIKERRLLVGDMEVKSLLGGSGEKKLLFLHGWKGTSESWMGNMEGLMHKYECVAIDLPGFGESDYPDVVWNLGNYAGFVKDVVSELGWQKCVLVGKSFGARVAIKLAGKDSEKLEGLVLVSAAGLEKKTAEVRLKILIAKSGGKMAGFLLGKDRSGYLRKAYYKLMGIELEDDQRMEIKKRVVAEDLSERLECIKVPTLMVWGSEDKVVPLEDGKQMARVIPNANLKVIDGGHWVHEESVDEFNEILEGWLKNIK